MKAKYYLPIAFLLVLFTISYAGFLKEINPKYNKSDCVQKIDSLQRVVDSLHDENFINLIELGRYEIALDILKERNLKAANQYEYILSHETE